MYFQIFLLKDHSYMFCLYNVLNSFRSIVLNVSRICNKSLKLKHQKWFTSLQVYTKLERGKMSKIVSCPSRQKLPFKGHFIKVSCRGVVQLGGLVLYSSGLIPLTLRLVNLF